MRRETFEPVAELGSGYALTPDLPRGAYDWRGQYRDRFASRITCRLVRLWGRWPQLARLHG